MATWRVLRMCHVGGYPQGHRFVGCIRAGLPCLQYNDYNMRFYAGTQLPTRARPVHDYYSKKTRGRPGLVLPLLGDHSIARVYHTLYSCSSSRIQCHGSTRDQEGHHQEHVERAKASALRMIGRRSHSRKELFRKLQERGYEDDVITSVLDRLEEVGLQSDAEHAVIFARSKWRQSRWSPRKIEMELNRKGVDKEHVTLALESVFGEEGTISVKRYMEEGPDTLYKPKEIEAASSLGHPEEALIQAAIRQYQSYGNHITKEAKRRRLTGWLQRRGFSWDDISRLVSMAESP